MSDAELVEKQLKAGLRACLNTIVDPMSKAQMLAWSCNAARALDDLDAGRIGAAARALGVVRAAAKVRGCGFIATAMGEIR